MMMLSSRILKLSPSTLRSCIRLSSSSEGLTELRNQENIVIYQKSQHPTIRAMLAISVVNFYVWSAVIFNHFMFDGQIIRGMDLSGDVTIGYVGTAATFALAYFTRHFANQCASYMYITKDKKRLGIQVHNLMGNPGKIFEVPVGKAVFSSNPTTEKRAFLRSGYVPIQVEGINSKVLVEMDGFFPDKQNYIGLLDSKRQLPEVKSSRIEWHKSIRRK